MNILIIDTNIKHMQKAVSLLKAYHHSVESASTLDAAVLRLHSSSFDLILLDLEFPAQLIDDFLRIDKVSNTPLIGMVQNPSILKAFRALKMNAKDVITKPLDLSKVTILTSYVSDSKLPDKMKLQKMNRQNILTLLEGKSH